MQTTDISTLFNYNYWANQRILQTAAQVTPEQFIAEAGASHGSLRATLVHTMFAEQVWRIRCQEGEFPTSWPVASDFATLEALVQYWRAEEQAMRAYLTSLSDSDLSRELHYVTLKGLHYAQPIWQILAHVVNHGTQHRSEAAMLLTSYGHSPGDIDMIVYFRKLLDR